jgi:hypothetical protein
LTARRIMHANEKHPDAMVLGTRVAQSGQDIAGILAQRESPPQALPVVSTGPGSRRQRPIRVCENELALPILLDQSRLSEFGRASVGSHRPEPAPSIEPVSVSVLC